jgi:hypothetical protein
MNSRSMRGNFICRFPLMRGKILCNSMSDMRGDFIYWFPRMSGPSMIVYSSLLVCLSLLAKKMRRQKPTRSWTSYLRRLEVKYLTVLSVASFIYYYQNNYMS